MNNTKYTTHYLNHCHEEREKAWEKFLATPLGKETFADLRTVFDVAFNAGFITGREYEKSTVRD